MNMAIMMLAAIAATLIVTPTNAGVADVVDLGGGTVTNSPSEFAAYKDKIIQNGTINLTGNPGDATAGTYTIGQGSVINLAGSPSFNGNWDFNIVNGGVFHQTLTGSSNNGRFLMPFIWGNCTFMLDNGTFLTDDGSNSNNAESMNLGVIWINQSAANGKDISVKAVVRNDSLISVSNGQFRISGARNSGSYKPNTLKVDFAVTNSTIVAQVVVFGVSNSGWLKDTTNSYVKAIFGPGSDITCKQLYAYANPSPSVILDGATLHWAEGGNSFIGHNSALGDIYSIGRFGLTVDIPSGKSLTCDQNASSLKGVGGITKIGEGSITWNQVSSNGSQGMNFTGPLVVSNGTWISTLDYAASAFRADGGMLALSGTLSAANVSLAATGGGTLTLAGAMINDATPNLTLASGGRTDFFTRDGKVNAYTLDTLTVRGGAVLSLDADDKCCDVINATRTYVTASATDKATIELILPDAGVPLGTTYVLFETESGDEFTVNALQAGDLVPCRTKVKNGRLVVSIGATECAITNVTCQQRHPWNGKVDIMYGATADVEPVVRAGNYFSLSVSAVDRENGTTNTAVQSALSGGVAMTAGVYHVVWDLNAQGLETKTDDMVFTVAYEEREYPLYCIVDLSSGENASSYPVTYLASPPRGGFNTDEYKTNKLVLRRIDAGAFSRGYISRPFFCGIFEVTQKQYSLVMGTNPSSFVGDNLPVEEVGYDEIRGSDKGAQWPLSSDVDPTSFMGRLRVRTGLSFDLPTEAQWEYACRAGTQTYYYWGYSMNGNYVWYEDNSENSTHPVGSKTENAWGLYDMSGNVWEWCLDWSNVREYGMDPKGATSGFGRVYRGGGWNSDFIRCGSGERDFLNPSVHPSIGFRIVGSLPTTINECVTVVEGDALSDEICRAESLPVVIDSRTDVLGRRADVVQWDSFWIGGDASAIVLISDNGTEIPLGVGAGVVSLSVGRHDLTYHTYIGGEIQPEIYEATVYRCNCAFTLGDVPLVETKVAKSETCTADGWTHEVRCARCNAVLEASSILPKLGHVPVETKSARAATCTAYGWSHEVKCSRCDAILEESVFVPGGHVRQTTVSAIAPTCTTDGRTREVSCRRCNTVVETSTAIPALGHQATETKAAKAATCTEDGWTHEVRCSRCNEVMEASTIIPALGGEHAWQAIAAIEPTCAVDGRTAGYVCSRCGATQESEVIPALGHIGAITKPPVEPTGSMTGLTAEITCTRCGEVLQEQTTIPALGYIRSVTARQLWPHKKVEVCYDVAEDIGEIFCDAGSVAATVTARYGNVTKTAVTLRGDNSFAPGLHRVVWDMGSDGIAIDHNAVVFTVVGGLVAENWSASNAVPATWRASENNAIRGLAGVFSGTRYNESGRVYSTDPISRLTDGVVNAAGASYDNTYAIRSGTLTWTLPTSVNLKMLRINTHWENGSRDGLSLSSVQVGRSSNAAWETLSNSAFSYGLSDNNSGTDLEFVYKNPANLVFARDVSAIRFNLGNQDNYGTGFTEFEAVYDLGGFLGPISVDAESVAVNTSSFVYDGMNVDGQMDLGYSPFADGEVKVVIDDETILSSTNSGVFVWQPQTAGPHTIKHISGTYEWTRTVEVNSLAWPLPSEPCPPTAEDENISIGTTTKAFAAGGGSGTITTSGSGTWSATASDSWITIPSAMASRNAGLPVVYQVKANADVASRTGYIYVSGHVFTITQAGVGAELYQQSSDFESDGGSGTFTVLADVQSEWDVKSNVDWISVTTDDNGGVALQGTGEGMVYYTVAPFNEISTRSGTITAAGCTFTVNQTGRRMKLSGSNITLTASGLISSFDYLRHVLAIQVNALASTEWEVVPGNSWISVVDPGGGLGGGSATISINENPSWLARRGTVRVGTEALTIAQSGRPAGTLDFAISPENSAASVKGANGLISVTATPDLPWTAQSQVNWLTVMPSFQNGAGNGNVVYSVSPNSTMADRSGTIVFSATSGAALPVKTHTVAQPAAVVTISETNHVFDAAGGTFDVEVTADDIVNWSISEDIDWISVVGDLDRIGPGTVTLAGAGNSTIYPREASLTIAGHAFSVRQLGRTVEVEYETRVFGAATDYSSLDVHPDGNVQWMAASSDPSWLTIWGDDGCEYDDDGNVIATGDHTIEYIVTDYTGDGTPRTATITIGDKTVYITQRPYDLSINPSSAVVGGNAGAGEIGVPATIGQIWTAIATEPWISIVTGYDSGTGSGRVLFVYTDNDTGKTRTGKIIISGETYTITQAARQMVTVAARIEGGKGHVSGSGTYDSGTDVTLTATAQDGYEFLNWTLPNGSTSGGAQLNVTADVNKEIIANFRRIPVYSVNGESVREGTSRTFTAPADVIDENGMRKLVCRGTSRYPDKGTSFVLVVYEDIDFEWDLWATNYLVTVQQASGGRILDGDGAVATQCWVPVGSTLNLAAIPDANKSFFRWNISPVSPNPVNLVETTSALSASLRLCVSQPLSVSAVFGTFSDTLADALDAPSLSFTTGGDANWLPVIDASAKSGYSSARSGAVGAESDTWLDTVVNGTGTLSFRWRVDCEKDDGGGATWDRLAVFTNGVEVARIDGKTDWQTVTLPISGKTTIRWSFYRDDFDESGAVYENAAWVDGVEWKEGR